MSYEIVTAPASEPITAAEAELHLRVEPGDEAALIQTLIVAAREQIETYLNKAVITQTVKAHFQGFSSSMVLPFGNAKSIEQIQYLDQGGVLQTMDASPSIYLLRTGSPARVELKYGESWPDALRQADSVSVTYVAGDAAAPPRIKAACKLIVGDLYENREAQIVGTIVAQNLAVERLLHPLRELGL